MGRYPVNQNDSGRIISVEASNVRVLAHTPPGLGQFCTGKQTAACMKTLPRCNTLGCTLNTQGFQSALVSETYLQRMANDDAATQ